MNFLLKNYEKIILGILLAIFIGLLAFQLELWRQSAQIKVDKLKGLQTPPPNYVAQAASGKFSVLQNLKDSAIFPVWTKSMARLLSEKKRSESQPVDICDFMIPYDMSVCPHCKLILPMAAFPPPDSMVLKECPRCRKALPAPQSNKKANLDSDNDGIPDSEELRLKLDPNNPDDADKDWDTDGFSNYEEYLYSTNINDPKSHPAFYEKMNVVRIERPMLPFILKNVYFSENKGKKTARIQIAFKVRRGKRGIVERNEEYQVNDTLNKVFAGNYVYKITRIIPYTEKTVSGTETEQYKVEIQKQSAQTSDTLILEIGKKVYENKEYLIIQAPDTTDPAVRLRPLPRLYLNSTFTIGNIRTGVEEYKVIRLYAEKNAAVLQYTSGLKSIQVDIGSESNVSKKIDQQKLKRSKKAKKAPASK